LADTGPCPEECAGDQSAALYFVSGAVTTTSWIQLIEAFVPLDAAASRLRAALSNCVSDEWLQVDPTCEPPNPDAPAQRLAEAQAAPAPPKVCGKELHVIALDGEGYDLPWGQSSASQVYVRVNRRGNHVLALSSYSPRQWNVFAGEGVVIDKVIANGYAVQQLEVPEGTTVDIYQTLDRGRDLEAYVHDWPVEYGTADAEVFVCKVEQLSGRALTSYQGCREGEDFEINPDFTPTFLSNCRSGEMISSYVDAPQCTE